MPLPAEVILVDGENLVARFQAMKAAGKKPLKDIVHSLDEVVWSPQMINNKIANIRRVSYYTSIVGDEEKLAAVEKAIRGISYTCRDETFGQSGHLFPRVYKKSGRAEKSRSVDINITIDALRYARGQIIQAVTPVSGDGDFVPLINELTHAGIETKVMALSSGLNLRLESVADDFTSLDYMFFEPSFEHLAG